MKITDHYYSDLHAKRDEWAVLSCDGLKYKNDIVMEDSCGS